MAVHDWRFVALVATLVTLASAQRPGGPPGPMESEDAGDPHHVAAHGTIACLAWLLLLIGAILMHVLRGPRTWLVHACVQAFGLVLVLIGAGMGINIAVNTDQLHTGHAGLGLFLFATVWLVAVGGVLQHLAFRKQGKRTIIGHIHMWTARALISLAVINGGLGLQLTGHGTGAYAAYGVVAAVIWLAWVGVTFGVKRA